MGASLKGEVWEGSEEGEVECDEKGAEGVWGGYPGQGGLVGRVGHEALRTGEYYAFLELGRTIVEVGYRVWEQTDRAWENLPEGGPGDWERQGWEFGEKWRKGLSRRGG